MKTKVYMSILVLLLMFTTSLLLVNANTKSNNYRYIRQGEVEEIDTTTNFYTQKENTKEIEIVDKKANLNLLGYKQVAANADIELWLLEEKLGIAIYDIKNGYTWFSSYENLNSLQLTEQFKAKIESGVSIEYYDANSSNVSSNEISIAYKSTANNAKPKDNPSVTYSNTYLKDSSGNVVGFTATCKFPAQGIVFDISVSIDGYNLIVDIPYESIIDGLDGVKYFDPSYDELTSKIKKKKYQLKSISAFPYLGSQNYEINGYSFIPDGSGALIRYTDEISQTGFVKTVYGNDYGIRDKNSENVHIKESGIVTLPIYGVNHGYNQAAFLCQIESGQGAAEIHSYPYGFNNQLFNTTFFKFITRDNYLVNFSDNSKLNLINEDVYPTNYTLKYSFLRGKEANYVGMANEYRKSLDLTANNNSGNINVQLDVLGVDYKQGLFGKNYIEMTTYEQALDIVKDLNSNNVSNVLLTYTGWNKGGYFNKSANNAKLHRTLGNKKSFNELVSYMNSNGQEIDFTINPTTSSTFGFGNPTVKRINLASFDTELESSLIQLAYYNNPASLSSNILKNNKKYSKLGINSLNIDNLSATYSYRYNQDSIYRSDMIDILCAELDKIEGYKLSTSNANAYLYKYLTNYYNTSYESSKYLYETDSIPFISILLSGYVNLYSPYINYISDYDLMNLRMIEYNLYPSFIVTAEEAYDLRFTNYEYLNSTQYALWESLIKSTYNTVNDTLKSVSGAYIVNHRYIAEGVSEITYSNNKVIYVNYNNSQYSNGSIQVGPNAAIVVEG